METKTNFLLKNRLESTTPTKDTVLNQIQSLRDKLNVIIKELDYLENDVKTMED